MKWHSGGACMILAASLLLAAQAHSALLRITPQGVAVDEQEETSPVSIGAEGFRLTYHGGGEHPLVDPVVLVFATPDGETPVVTWSGASSPDGLSVSPTLGGENVYGGEWNELTGDAGTYGEADWPNRSVYEKIGFTPPGSDSQNYPNWHEATGETSWSLSIYTLTFNPAFDRGNWVEFNTMNLALNSFVVGYGCTELSGNSNDEPLCRNSGSTESTPFTFAGLVTPVPEPGLLTLLGAGLLAMGFARRRFRV